jgi:hypothetical protein
MHNLPPKIHDAVRRVLLPTEGVIALLPTRWKPDPDTPFLWAALTTRRLFLFSTRSRGKIHSQAEFQQINAILLERSGRHVRVLFWDESIPDLAFPIDVDVSSQAVQNFIDSAKNKLTARVTE